jgi:hypothetical protein
MYTAISKPVILLDPKIIFYHFSKRLSTLQNICGTQNIDRIKIHNVYSENLLVLRT